MNSRTSPIVAHLRRSASLALAISLLLTILASAPPAHAQGGEDAACPALVEAALAAVDTACADLGRGEACYGHTRVEAVAWDEAAALAFSAPADRVSLLDLRRLETAPLNLATAEWGVAVLSLQARVEGALPGQAVTFLLMGDASLENAVPPEEPASDDGFAPMQAVYFASGLGRPACHDAPSALMIQSPSGTEVALRINDLDITLGSTIVVATTTIPLDGQEVPVMVVALVQGHATILLNGQVIGMEQPSWEAPGPLPVYAVTLNAAGRVDADSRVMGPPLDAVQPVVAAACLDGLAMLDQMEDSAVCGAPLAPALIAPQVSITAEPPPAGEEDGGTWVGLMWHLSACVHEPEAITNPVSFQWGVGCFDTAASANAHANPAAFQLFVDGMPLDMGRLDKRGPEVHAPVCPYGWGYYYPNVTLSPGAHTLTLNQTLLDSWEDQSGGGEAGTTNTMGCVIHVVR